eukprot:GHVS01002123.1.p1 GENE.GHVS01002123.1~~GHVS01002123.1.p1  ORF type:complete len:658 (-),score=190.98 GHVS01002123.1:240-1976(-)
MVATAFAAFVANAVGWREAFTIPAATCFCMGLLLFFFLLDPPSSSSSVADQTTDNDNPSASSSSSCSSSPPSSSAASAVGTKCTNSSSMLMTRGGGGGAALQKTGGVGKKKEKTENPDDTVLVVSGGGGGAVGRLRATQAVGLRCSHCQHHHHHGGAGGGGGYTSATALSIPDSAGGGGGYSCSVCGKYPEETGDVEDQCSGGGHDEGSSSNSGSHNSNNSRSSPMNRRFTLNHIPASSTLSAAFSYIASSSASPHCAAKNAPTSLKVKVHSADVVELTDMTTSTCYQSPLNPFDVVTGGGSALAVRSNASGGGGGGVFPSSAVTSGVNSHPHYYSSVTTTPHQHPHGGSGSSGSSGSRKSWTYLEIIMMPNLLNVAGAYFCVKLVRYSLLFWLPYFLTKQLQYEPSIAGYSSMMFDIGGIAGAVATGYLADTVLGGKRLTAAACMCLTSAISLLTFAWASHGGVFSTLAVMGVVGFSIAGPDSVLGAAAAQDLCERSGMGLPALSVAAGFINGTGGVGAVLQGYITAFLSEAYGWDTLFGTLCLMSVLAMILLMSAVLAENRPRRTRNIGRTDGVHL